MGRCVQTFAWYCIHIVVLVFLCYNFILLSIADTGSQLLRRLINKGSLASSIFMPLLSMAPCTATCLSLRAVSPYTLNLTCSLPRIPPTRRAFSIQSRAARLVCLAASRTSALHHPQTLGIRSLPGPCLVVFMRVKFMTYCKKQALWDPTEQELKADFKDSIEEFDAAMGTPSGYNTKLSVRD